MRFRNKQAPALNKWLGQLLARAHQNKVIVALANKMIRIAWAVLYKNERYHMRSGVHLLRVTVSNLCRKLASGYGIHRPIVTESGVGYRLRYDSHSAPMLSLTPR
jgi:hypothetical protein